LTEENFQLKQKQREFIHQQTVLRGDNEQLALQVEEEIKRMNSYVDQLTKEADSSKDQLIQEYEQKLLSERR